MADAQATEQAKADIDRQHKNLDRHDHFQLLGVDEDTDPEKVRQAFLMLAKRWHTDNFADFDLGKRQRKLDEIFARINEAYETLEDPKRREEYLVLRQRKQAGLATDVNAVFQAEALVDQGVACIRRQQWRDAVAKLTEARSLNPDDPLYDVHLAWATYNAQRKNPENVSNAQAMLKDAVKRQESLPQGYHYLGQIAFNQEKYAEARRWWKLCLEWDEKNVEALRGLRLINTRAGKKKSGIGAFFDKLLGK